MLHSIHPKKLAHVVITLTLAVIAIYVPPYTAYAEHHAWFLIGTAGVVILLALLQRIWLDVVLALGVALTFGISMMLFPDTDSQILVFRTAAIAAFVLLHATLLIGPWSRYTPRLLVIYKYRRHVGVTTFLLALTHASLLMKLYFSYSLSNAFMTSFTFFGFTTLFILLWLAVTSWDMVQKTISNTRWSIIHAAILFGYLVSIYMLYQSNVDMTATRWIVIGLFLVYWLMVAPWSLPKKVLTWVHGWKQLHMLIYVAYVSVVMHVWIGMAQYQTLGVRTAFWILVSVVTASHAVGWVMVLKNYLQTGTTQSEPPVEEQGKTFVRVGPRSELVNGRGKRYMVNGTPVAVFAQEEKLFGMSAVCPHQGGPIEKGTIKNGYVECPWHKYQFDVNNGSGPPGFPDCIPYYDVFERNGDVYVCTTPTDACPVVDGLAQHR